MDFDFEFAAVAICILGRGTVPRNIRGSIFRMTCYNILNSLHNIQHDLSKLVAHAFLYFLDVSYCSHQIILSFDNAFFFYKMN